VLFRRLFSVKYFTLSVTFFNAFLEKVIRSVKYFTPNTVYILFLYIKEKEYKKEIYNSFIRKRGFFALWYIGEKKQ
jgi:bifunctional pyridoxal-dependent enzyme with beta-cystathionase and maltose regulon repressor activities